MVRLVAATLLVSSAVFLGLFVLGSGPGPAFALRGPGDEPAELVVQAVTAHDLRKAYSIEGRGESAYGNRPVEVHGVCLGVRRDRDGVPFVMLARPGQQRPCVV